MSRAKLRDLEEKPERRWCHRRDQVLLRRDRERCPPKAFRQAAEGVPCKQQLWVEPVQRRPNVQRPREANQGGVRGKDEETQGGHSGAGHRALGGRRRPLEDEQRAEGEEARTRALLAAAASV